MDENEENKIVNTDETLESEIKEVEAVEPTENIETSDIEEKKYDEVDKSEVEEEKINDKKEEITNEKKHKKKSNKAILIILIIVLIVLLLLLCSIFALLNLNNTKIISGVLVNNIDISNLTKEEAKEKIEKEMAKKSEKEVTFYYNDYELKIIPSQLEVTYNIDEIINTAYIKGRSNNLLKDNFEILSTLIFKNIITPNFTYNEDALNSLINEMQENIPNHLVQTGYYIEGKNLIISNGTDGLVVTSSELKNTFSNYICDFLTENNKFKIPTNFEKAKEIDIDKIYSEVVREPKNAYYTKEPYAVYSHVDGIDFDISIEDAKKLLEEEKENYTIPLKLISPEITVSKLGVEAFPDLLSSFTTKFSTSNTNRTTNIKLATNKINGIVIMPGEIFSYNQVVGQRTAAAGYKSAAVYVGGKVTNGIGGGICQVSSTLYNAALLANLEIVARDNHCFNPGYVKAGTDATVSWGGPEFIFKNNRKYPIKIVCSAENGKSAFKIYGCKEEIEYEVVIDARVVSYIPFKTIYENTKTLPVGETKVIESGSNGCKTITYRILKLNGKEVSRTLLSKDTYNPHNRVIAVGVE